MLRVSKKFKPKVIPTARGRRASQLYEIPIEKEGFSEGCELARSNNIRVEEILVLDANVDPS